MDLLNVTTEIIYKVVTELDNRYYSIMIPTDNKFCVEYFLYEKVYPPIKFPNAHLFAFNNLKNARKFRKLMQRLIVIRKTYHNLSAQSTQAARIFIATSSKIVSSPKKVIVRKVLEDTLANFWTLNKHTILSPDLASFPPIGTVFCNDITLLAKIKEKYIS